MKPAPTAFALISLLLAAATGQGAEKRKAMEKSPGTLQATPAAGVKPALERVVDGVQLTVFNTDLNGRPSPDRAWLLVTNLHAQPVTITGSVAHSFDAVLAGGGRDLAGTNTMSLSEPFAHVLDAGQKVMIWYCDRGKANGTPINIGDS